MPKDIAHEAELDEHHEDKGRATADTEDAPTQGGLTREELRAIVVEMIG